MLWKKPITRPGSDEKNPAILPGTLRTAFTTLFQVFWMLLPASLNHCLTLLMVVLNQSQTPFHALLSVSQKVCHACRPVSVCVKK